MKKAPTIIGVAGAVFLAALLLWVIGTQYGGGPGSIGVTPTATQPAPVPSPSSPVPCPGYNPDVIDDGCGASGNTGNTGTGNTGNTGTTAPTIQTTCSIATDGNDPHAQVTVTNPGESDINVSDFTVAFYNSTGQETSSHQVVFGQVVTAGQTMRTTDVEAEDPGATTDSNGNWVYSGDTCQVLSWDSGM